MILPERITRLVAGLQLDPRLNSDADRVTQFVTETGKSRMTYYRIKKSLPEPQTPPATILKRAAKLRLVQDDP